MIGVLEIKWLLYFGVLGYAGYKDFKTMTIPDRVHIIIIVLALLSSHSAVQFFSGFIIGIPFLITALMHDGAMGGGDVKFMAANGVFLGVTSGVIACILGLLMAVIFNIFYEKITNKSKKEFPLAPYLSMGCFLSSLIQISNLF